MGSFCQEAREQCDIMKAMAKKMEEQYEGLRLFFVVEEKCKLEEFMQYVKKFKDDFKVRKRLLAFVFRLHGIARDASFVFVFQKHYVAILKEREEEEKQVRAREARERQERERQERAAKKRALVDFNEAGDQEGVMDSLLQALSSGSAFNREQKRKRAPRAAGGKI